MKILILSHKFYPDIGGIESITEMLASEFQNHGHQIHILTWTKEIGSKSFAYLVVRNPGKLMIVRETIWADVILENNPCLQLSWPRLFIKRPAVVSLQTWLHRRNGQRSLPDKLKLYWLGKANQVVACSQAIQRTCWPSAIVIDNPYNKELFADRPNSLRVKDFVFLGRLVSDKGANLAIEAFNKLQKLLVPDVFPHLSLTIIGSGPEMQNLKDQARILRIEDKVDFAGALNGAVLVDKLREHKYILIPSVWEEPFGIVVLEGIACGCIPVASNGGGLPDAVGKAGILFKRGDVGSLVESMLQLLQSEELQTQLLAAAPAHLKVHTAKYISRKYLDVIESVMKTSKT